MTADDPGTPPPPQSSPPPPGVTPDLRLRGERPRVTRLSRKVVIGLGGVAALAIAGALGYGLQSRDKGQAGQELLS
jgi:type IV secretion system protein VirB10